MTHDDFSNKTERPKSKPASYSKRPHKNTFLVLKKVNILKKNIPAIVRDFLMRDLYSSAEEDSLLVDLLRITSSITSCGRQVDIQWPLKKAAVH